MIKEFKDESQAKAIADSLGLLITKYRGVYIISNSKEELLANYNLGYFQKEGIFYDKEVFKENTLGFIVIKDTTLVDASSVELPYGLKNCACMFSDCISLKIPPIIPAWVEDCSYLFCGCTSLETPPIIPEGVKDCSCMFSGCTSLEISPIIPDSAGDCSCMFYECLSLEIPPKIPDSAGFCSFMFSGCTSLGIPPKIPEGVLNCQRMFRGCISLKSPPNFPENCYTIDALDDTPFAESRGGN